MSAFEREISLIGKDKFNKISNAKIAVFGVGGVGGFVVEALVRSGVKYVTVFDNDIVNETNLNRQIISLKENVGKLKVEVIKERALKINPDCVITVNPVFYLPSNADDFPFDEYDYVVDAVDTVSAKISIIENAKKYNVPVISCMGTGNKWGIKDLTVTDIKNTFNCPLARVMRRELKKRNVENVKVVYSKGDEIVKGSKVIPSMIFVPAVAGLMIAEQVIGDITGDIK